MKLLILSCSTGEGHNAAAQSIAGAWRAQGGAARYWTPWVLAEIPHSALKLLAYIEENAFDVVLCTHLFPMEAVTYLKRKSLLNCPCYGVLTDYTCIPFFEETELDRYFSPHPEVTQVCASMGMDAAAFTVTGIPVRQGFTERLPKAQARAALDMPQSRYIYLIMTGGMGCGNILALCKWMLHEDYAAELYVLTGHNEALLQDLSDAYGTDGQVRPVGFTDRVNVYMNAADVLLTKPGGISSTEAAVAGVPTVHTTPIPGCEMKNATFFASHGLSLYGKTVEEAAALAKTLVTDDEKANAMRTAQKALVNLHASADIVHNVRCSG